jgi:two-component system phosphate regulon sensor histidine kinase PhoR
MIYLFILLCLFVFWLLYPRNKETKKQSSLFLDALDEGILFVGLNQNILFVNENASQMLNLKKSELIGENLRKFTNHSFAAKLQNLIETSLKRDEVLTDSFSQIERYFEFIALPEKSKNRCILVLKNKSAHRKFLDSGKDFITNASHELKTPITIIKGFAETLQDMPQLPKEIVTEIIKKIVTSCERMDHLIKNLLILADLENFSLVRAQVCDLGELLENCKELLLQAHPSLQFELINEESVEIQADPSVLELAFMNLFENAIKYSPKPAKIAVTAEKKNDHISITIQDWGIGIPQESLEQIFNRFYTVDKARSQACGGVGLGLSITRMIVEKHHGEIKVTSEIGKGSMFTLTFPVLAFALAEYDV